MATVGTIAREALRYRTLVEKSLAWRAEMVVPQAGAAIAPAVAELVTSGTAIKAVMEGTEAFGSLLSSVTWKTLTAAQIDAYQSMRSLITPRVLPATTAVTEELQRRLARLTEEQREYDKALADQNYRFPVSMAFTDFLTAGRLATGKRGGIELRKHMTRLLRDGAARDLASTWDHPSFRERNKIVRLAIEDHERGRYLASVPTMLPLVEGIAFAVFLPGSPGIKMDPIWKAAAEHVQEQALLTSVSYLFAYTGFDRLAKHSRLLNRHAVLHGRVFRYGTEYNSARMIYALDHLHAIVKASGA